MMPHAAATALISRAGPGQAVLVDRGYPGTGLVFSIGQRETSHMRHWHKYSGGQLPRDRRCYFRRDLETLTGATLGSAGELQRELQACEDSVIVHHCRHGDFSRWVAEVLGDPPLAAAIAAAEDAVRASTTGAEAARPAMVAGDQRTSLAPQLRLRLAVEVEHEGVQSSDDEERGRGDSPEPRTGGPPLSLGALGDRVGRKWAFLAGLLVFAAGSAVSAFSGSVGLLPVGRFVMGVGAAALMPCTLSILTNALSAGSTGGPIRCFPCRSSADADTRRPSPRSRWCSSP